MGYLNSKKLFINFLYLQGTFYSFNPTVSSCVEGKIVSKTSSSITVAVLDYFHIQCLSPKNIKKLEVGQTVNVKVSSVVFVDGRPNMMGDIDKVETIILSITCY